MAGRDVTRQDLDREAANAVIAVREAFRQVATVKAFLDQVPKTDTTDPLTLPTVSTGVSDVPAAGKPAVPPAKPTVPAIGRFGYTEDEAYLLRMTFDQLTALAVKPILDTARKLTGLS